MSIAIAIGFVFLILFILGGAAWGPWAQAPNEKNKANGNDNARANFDWNFFSKIFKRPANCEDGSKLDDFWTKSIASARTIFRKMFERTSERTNEPNKRNKQFFSKKKQKKIKMV